MTSAIGMLSTTAHCNLLCTHLVQPLYRKQCCSAVRDSTRRERKLVCGSMERPFCRSKRAPGNGSQVAHQPVVSNSEQQTPQAVSSRDSVLALGMAFGSILLQSAPAIAFTVHQEPENALSFPTWVIHISSVIEWAIAMSLVWKYAEVTGNTKWKGLTWGMMPLLAGALCACTYHFFYNSSDLDFLVAVQASLTWIGNATCAAAAYRIYKSAEQEGAA